MSIFRFSLRLPADLHKDALKEVNILKEMKPGASLNDLICEALRNHLDQKTAERKASAN